MKLTRTWLLMILLALMSGVIGCAGTQTFTPAVRSGDTVALPVGWQQTLVRQNLTVTVTPSSGSPVTYLPNDPKVRAIINLYPDPSSGLVVGMQTGQDLGNNDAAMGRNVNNFITGGDREWWQTMILLDLLSSLPTGPATISFVDSTGVSVRSANVTIVPGTGSSNLFNVYYPWAGSSGFDLATTYPSALKTLERTGRYTVTFNTYQDASGLDVIPHSIQVEFTHTSGVGVPWVVNPRGDIKNVLWSDNGTNLKVIVTPTKAKTLLQGPGIAQLRFYIAGGITGLAQTDLKAYDVNGNLMSGVTATVQ